MLVCTKTQMCVLQPAQTWQGEKCDDRCSVCGCCGGLWCHNSVIQGLDSSEDVGHQNWRAPFEKGSCAEAVDLFGGINSTEWLLGFNWACEECCHPLIDEYDFFMNFSTIESPWLTKSWLTLMGSLNTVQITASVQSGMVREPWYR